jgi:uncharacterized protein YjbJ (UPF0337 family)
MTWDIIEGQWNDIKGRLRSRWGRLTNDDLTVIAGQREVLIGRLQQRYGFVRAEAELEVEGWLARI